MLTVETVEMLIAMRVIIVEMLLQTYQILSVVHISGVTPANTTICQLLVKVVIL